LLLPFLTKHPILLESTPNNLKELLNLISDVVNGNGDRVESQRRGRWLLGEKQPMLLGQLAG
jgi:hypothetical protein